jgi:hypothetical protein
MNTLPVSVFNQIINLQINILTHCKAEGQYHSDLITIDKVKKLWKENKLTGVELVKIINDLTIKWSTK